MKLLVNKFTLKQPVTARTDPHPCSYSTDCEVKLDNFVI